MSLPTVDFAGGHGGAACALKDFQMAKRKAAYVPISSVRLEDCTATYVGGGLALLERSEAGEFGVREHIIGLSSDDRSTLRSAVNSVRHVILSDGVVAEPMGDEMFVLCVDEWAGHRKRAHRIALSIQDLDTIEKIAA